MKKELQEYFKNNFIDSKGKIKGLKKISLYKSHKNFLDKLFSLEPSFNQDNLKLIHIEYFLFKNYSYDDLKCLLCDKLKDVKHGKSREPFMWSCEEHKEDAKKLINKHRSKLQKEKMKNKSYIEKMNKKRIQTNIEKYGVKEAMQNKVIKEKSLKSQKEKFGDCVLVAKKDQIKKTNLEKYGSENPMQNEKIKKKALETVLRKYNVKNVAQINKKNLDKLNKEFIEENFFNEKKNFKINKFMKFYNYSEAQPYKILKIHNIEYKKRGGASQYEDEIYDYIKSLDSLNVLDAKDANLNIIRNDRSIIKPKELDIYISEKNLAIEFNGIYWHSIDEVSKINNYKHKHLNKTLACEAKGVNLLHINENEWIDPQKQEIFKSIIKYKLGFIDQKYFARKLQIKELNAKDTIDFLNENHLQGYVAAKVNIGLFYNDKLISLMTFSKPRYNKNYEYELIRFASKKNTSCIGCASRLLKYFIKEYKVKSIITYANRRWANANSNLYQTLGFKFLREVEPNYYYFKLDELKFYHRSKFQKHKLKNLKETKDFYDSSKTEAQIMFESGYRRIYDSGNLVFELKKD